jgi:hypothetical protein
VANKLPKTPQKIKNQIAALQAIIDDALHAADYDNHRVQHHKIGPCRGRIQRLKQRLAELTKFPCSESKNQLPSK